MNKTIWALGGFACLSLIMLLARCGQNASPSQEVFQKETAFDDLQQKIYSFDLQFQQQNESELRGFWSSVRDIFLNCGAVVIADVVALADNSSVSMSINSEGKLTPTGTLNVGKAVSASVATAKEVFSASQKQTERKTSWSEWQARPAYSLEYTGSIVGEAHNEIIKELCKLYKDKDLEEVSDEQMYQDILKLTLEYYNLSPNVIDKNVWKVFQSSAEKICSEVAHKTPEEAIAYLRAYPKGDKKELNIIADYLIKISSLPTEDLRKEYAKGFHQTIKVSAISEQSKQTIMNATATGLNSIALWEQK